MLLAAVRYVEESQATAGEAGFMHHRRIISVVALLLTLSACSWGQTLGNSGRTGWNSLPGAISPENVSTLHYLWKPVDGTFLAALDNDFAYGAGSSDSDGRSTAATSPVPTSQASRCGGVVNDVNAA